MKSLFKQLVPGSIFFLFGILFFAIGSGMTIHQRTLEEQGMEAQGVVVDLQENYDSDGSTYSSVVQFITSNGQNFEFVSSYSSSPPAHDIGENVTVVYPPGDPSNAIIKGEGQFLRIIFMALGGVSALVGFWQIYRIIRDYSVMGSDE